MTKTYLKYRSRIITLASFVIISWMGLCARLFQIQVLNGAQYQATVIKQAQKKQNIPLETGYVLHYPSFDSFLKIIPKKNFNLNKITKNYL